MLWFISWTGLFKYISDCLWLHTIKSPPAIIFPPINTGAHFCAQGCRDGALHVQQHCSRQRNRMPLSQRVQAGSQIHPVCWWRAEIKYHLNGTKSFLGDCERQIRRGGEDLDQCLQGTAGGGVDSTAVWGFGQMQTSCVVDRECQSLLRPPALFYDEGKVKSINP